MHVIQNLAFKHRVYILPGAYLGEFIIRLIISNSRTYATSLVVSSIVLSVYERTRSYGNQGKTCQGKMFAERTAIIMASSFICNKLLPLIRKQTPSISWTQCVVLAGPGVGAAAIRPIITGEREIHKKYLQYQQHSFFYFIIQDVDEHAKLLLQFIDIGYPITYNLFYLFHQAGPNATKKLKELHKQLLKTYPQEIEQMLPQQIANKIVLDSQGQEKDLTATRDEWERKRKACTQNSLPLLQTCLQKGVYAIPIDIALFWELVNNNPNLAMKYAQHNPQYTHYILATDRLEESHSKFDGSNHLHVKIKDLADRSSIGQSTQMTFTEFCRLNSVLKELFINKVREHLISLSSEQKQQAYWQQFTSEFRFIIICHSIHQNYPYSNDPNIAEKTFMSDKEFYKDLINNGPLLSTLQQCSADQVKELCIQEVFPQMALEKMLLYNPSIDKNGTIQAGVNKAKQHQQNPL